jgi:hypothetical protein
MTPQCGDTWSTYAARAVGVDPGRLVQVYEDAEKFRPGTGQDALEGTFGDGCLEAIRAFLEFQDGIVSREYNGQTGKLTVEEYAEKLGLNFTVKRIPGKMRKHKPLPNQQYFPMPEER